MGDDLTSGPVAGHLRRQATPMALGLVAIISFDAVDLFFVSRLGDAALAAIAFCFPVIWLLEGIAIGYEAGAASCISRAVGARDTARAQRLTTDTAVLALLATSVVCLFGLATIEPSFRLLGATDELLPLIHDYMGILYFVEPLATMMWVSLASMRARGNTLLEGKVIAVAALLNAVLDPIFIFGWFGFPRLEIAGAALASLVANIVMLAFTLYYLNRLRVFATLFVPLARMLVSWRQMLAIGLPAMMTNAIIPVSNAIVVTMIAAIGVDAVAGYGIAMRVEPFALIVFYALSAVSSPFAGQNYAAGKYDRVLQARRVSTRFCLVSGLVLALGLSLVIHPLASLFTDSAAIRDVAVRYVWMVSISYGAYGLIMSINASFNGIGHPKPGVVISTLRVIVVFLPLAFLGRSLFGIEGIFAASTLSNILVGAVAYYWFGAYLKRSLAVVDQ